MLLAIVLLVIANWERSARTERDFYTCVTQCFLSIRLLPCLRIVCQLHRLEITIVGLPQSMGNRD